MTLKRPLFAFGLLTLTACGGANAPAAPPAAPSPPAAAPAAASPALPPQPADPKTDLASKIDPIFSAYATGKAPGCSVGVYRAGQVAYAKGYGYADLDHDAPNTETTPFYLASVSKQFTATAVLLLAQDGKVALEDDIRKYVPELPSYGKAPITLAHLLHHTSGVRDFGLMLALQGTDGADVVNNEDVLWSLAHQRSLNFPPGTRHLYSNSGYVLLSLVVERVSGKPLGAFLKERVFEPLGMSDTFVKSDHMRLTPGRAIGYELRPDKTYGVAISNSEYTGPGNVVSSVRDLAKWDANFYDPKVGGRALIDGLRTQGKLNDGRTIEYAMGLSEDRTHGIRREEHDGGFVGYRTLITRYPDEKLTVTVLCNDSEADPNELESKVAAVFLPALGEPEKPEAGGVVAQAAAFGEDPAAVAGTYLNEATFEVRVVEPKDGELHLLFARAGGGRHRVLVPVGTRELAVRGGTAHYTFEPANGKAPAMLTRKSDAGGVDTYVRIEPVGSLPAAKLTEYAGRYGSDELARDIEFVVKDGQLVPRPWGGRFAQLAATPVARDRFALDDIGCTFQRDPSGKVNGVIVTTGRSIGLHLQKRAK